MRPNRTSTSRNQTEPNLWRLVGLAVANLYSETPAAVYEEIKYRGVTSYLDACIATEIAPVMTESQKELQNLMLHDQRAVLYVAADEVGAPSHGISLKRGHEGLWYVAGRHIMDRPSPPRDGFLAYWKTVSADAAVNMPVEWRRVYGGGQSIAALGQEIMSDYETRLRASHAYVVMEFHQSATPEKFEVCASDRGKLRFKVHKDVGDGWVRPYEFEAYSGRPYAELGEEFKARCRVWGSARGEDLWMGDPLRYLIPETRTHLGPLEEDFKYAANLLRGGVLPMIGVQAEKRYVQWCGLSYDPQAKSSTIVVYHKGRISSGSGPSLVRKGVNISPNLSLMRLLGDMIEDRTDERLAHCKPYRLAQICKFLDKLKITSANRADQFFRRHGVVFSAYGEKQLLQMPFIEED